MDNQQVRHVVKKAAEAGEARPPANLDGTGNESEALRLALLQAVVSLGGLGGMIHLAGGGGPLLRLVSILGIPLDIQEKWRTVEVTGESAPALALRGGTTVWLPSADP